MNIEAALKEVMAIDGLRLDDTIEDIPSPPTITEPEMITTTMPASRRGHRP